MRLLFVERQKNMLKKFSLRTWCTKNLSVIESYARTVLRHAKEPGPFYPMLNKYNVVIVIIDLKI